MNLSDFDYVVISGGTSGLVLATRLVEDPAIRVCVLEAGEDITVQRDVIVPGCPWVDFIAVPSLCIQVSPTTTSESLISIGGFTTTQANADGRSFHLARGHTTEYDGQSSITLFPNETSSFDRRAELREQSETFAATPEQRQKYQVAFNPTTYGTDGPVQRTLPTWFSDFEVGGHSNPSRLNLNPVQGAFSGNPVGMWSSNRSIDAQGTRSSSAAAYYEPNKSKPNLVVITGAQVTRILFNANSDFGTENRQPNTITRS
ncbi:hypothetical protein C8R44DRAFT_845155 [Mycena epipterygia]|nr:hypothetical protein C8R44DRAFT_845155 [Mycena epipterygia]